MTPATCTRCGFTDDYPAKRGDRIKNMRCHACDRKGALARVGSVAAEEVTQAFGIGRRVRFTRDNLSASKLGELHAVVTTKFGRGDEGVVAFRHPNFARLPNWFYVQVVQTAPAPASADWHFNYSRGFHRVLYVGVTESMVETVAAAEQRA